MKPILRYWKNPHDPEKLQTFIRQVETRSQRYPEYRDNKVDHARRFMAGSVLERWVLSQPDIWQLSWPDFLARPRNSSLDPSYGDKVEMQLERLKQTSTVAKYVEDFTHLKALLPPGLKAESSFKRVFVMGLKASY